MSLSLVAGLGNPGREHASTRHNIGWVVIDALAKKHGLAWRSDASFQADLARWDVAPGRVCWLVKPQTFMNDSGGPVGAVARFHKVPNGAIGAVHDDLTIETSRLKVSVGGSAGGHNGVASLIEHLGEDFARFRIGIGPKHPPFLELKDYVLGAFTPEQLALLNPKLDSYVQGLELLIASGADTAMNQLNRKDSTP